jgi:hypothetical protein
MMLLYVVGQAHQEALAAVACSDLPDLECNDTIMSGQLDVIALAAAYVSAGWRCCSSLWSAS